MAVSRQVGFYRTGDSAIRSADPENPCLYNQTWSGSDAPFARYSPLNYTATLKLGFGVIQGHRKWHYSIEHIRLYIRLLRLYLLPFPRYSRILVENCYPFVFGAPLGVKPSDLRNDPW